MTQFNDAISVRSTRLNNVLLGFGRNYGVSSSFSETLTRESLLDAFCVLYNECSKEALRKRDKNISDFVHKFRDIIEETRKLRVNISDFQIRALIGQGYFGTVHLVVERHTNDVYAMKKIRKSVMTTSQVKEERIIMSRRCSEWITKLQYSFQDNDYLYLVMEYLPGGDLLSLMSRHGPFDEELTRFYLAELTEAIHSLHEMGYVHRDIKPENILIDRFGHIRLGDFGNAAALDRDGYVLSLSPVGTPDYIAPELLQTISTYKLTKNMHDVSCDYWSMGIIGYELICEVTPFHEDNVHETYSKILSHCEESQLKELISFPSDLKLSDNYKYLIESLVTNPSNRLGYNDIRKHAFFNTVKWESLRSQVPPIIPNLKGEDDTSNFEDVLRNKTRTAAATTNVKKPFTLTMPSNEFCGKDLPFIGYSFVHLERQDVEGGALEDARFVALNNKLKDFQLKYKERLEDISKLNQKLLRAELTTKQSATQTKILQDAKEEIAKMKDSIKEKNTELAKCRTQVKTLQSSLKIEQEMWAKKEATITEVLCMNRQKYEEAKNATEMRYEKRIAEKKVEMAAIIKKLDEREAELSAKVEECLHMQEKVDNYKEMLKLHKEQAQKESEEFEKHRTQLTETYEQKLADLRSRLRHERDSRSRLTMELRDVRTELDDTINCRHNSEEAKLATAKTNDEILKRLNHEIEINNEMNKRNVALEQLLLETQRAKDAMQQEVHRLERDLQVAECSKTLTESVLAAEADAATMLSPYQTAPGSLTDVRLIEESLRADLEAAKENENAQKVRADKLQEIVTKLEKMMEKFNEHSMSPTKPLPAPRLNCAGNHLSTAGEFLEKQNEKLEDKLATVREQMILEKQAARTANLALWKLEKQLEESMAEKKALQRRIELSEERLKKTISEREQAQRQCRLTEEGKRQREEQIEELKKEMVFLKKDLHREHLMWERAEQERMKCKSEIIEFMSNCKRLEERVAEYQQKLQQSQQRCDKLDAENKRLINDMIDEKERHTSTADQMSILQMELKNLKDNYERLKYACTIADNQLTEIEVMLEKEQTANKLKQQKLDQLLKDLHKKDEIEIQLRAELQAERMEKETAESRVQTLTVDLEKQCQHVKQLQKRLDTEQKHVAEHTALLFATHEKIEMLQNENKHWQNLSENRDRELVLLKEENARILSDLFHAKEEVQQLQNNLRDALEHVTEMQNELINLQSILEEKEQFYVQRDIKSEATLAQHKKLIDYLQLKVEDLTTKKKKTLADKLFGTSHQPSSALTMNTKKEAAIIESSILYRTLQEELKRQQMQCKTLQEQLNKMNGVSTLKFKSPLKVKENAKTVERDTKDEINNKIVATQDKSPSKKGEVKGKRESATVNRHHRFELALQESHLDASQCVACEKLIVAGSPYWKCKECKQVAHRKCRSNVVVACNAGLPDHAASLSVEAVAPNKCDSDTDSMGKYSYEAKLDGPDDPPSASYPTLENVYSGTLVFAPSGAGAANDGETSLEVLCAVEMEENKILLFGCNVGLYAYHIETSHLVRIAGIDAISCIAICRPLNKTILIGSNGDNLYQCDLRHLQSRSQANACLKLALEASVLDLSFAKRGSSEKWQMVQISEESEQPFDAVAIAVTSARVVILIYDINQQKFKPIRALDTATPVTSITYTRHTAIVTSDKFFEIDLDTYGAEEFVDIADKTLYHTRSCQPMKALRISKQEILLCFMECGIFVDEYGCRSRPYDLNWEYTPTGFLYRSPFLYVAHFQSVQIIRLHRSYSKEVCVATSIQKDSDADKNEAVCELKRVHLRFYMPSLLCESGQYNLYILALHKETAQQEIYQLEALQAFKQLLNESLETLSSIATSITSDAATTN